MLNLRESPISNLIELVHFDTKLAFNANNLQFAGLSNVAWDWAFAAGTENFPSEKISKEVMAWLAEPTPIEKTISAGAPFHLSINVTQVCNLHCTYCAAGGDGTYGSPIKRMDIEKTIPQLKRLFESDGNWTGIQIVFLGGEALLYPTGIRLIADFLRQWASEKKLPLSINVVTNGTLFTEENVNLLAEINASISVSVDGPPAYNDIARIYKGGKDKRENDNRGNDKLSVGQKIEAGLKRLFLRRADLRGVRAYGTFGRHHMKLREAYDYYRAQGFDGFQFTLDHHELSPELSREFNKKLLAIGDFAWREGGEAELRRITNFDDYFLRFETQIPNKTYCGAGSTYFVLDAKNDVYPCHWMVGDLSKKIGDLSGLDKARQSQWLSQKVWSPDCHKCWAKNICGGGCAYVHAHSSNGNVSTPDPLFCERTREQIQFCMDYFLRGQIREQKINEDEALAVDKFDRQA
jgi:uncharacterized protein